MGRRAGGGGGWEAGGGLNFPLTIRSVFQNPVTFMHYFDVYDSQLIRMSISIPYYGTCTQYVMIYSVDNAFILFYDIIKFCI